MTHTARILDGKALAASLRAQIKLEVEQFYQKHGVRVGLAAILDTQNPASKIYVGMKEKACAEVGIYSKIVPLRGDQAELMRTIAAFNADPQIHGILVQLPLPSHMQVDPVIDAINPAKDADGFHPYNLGKLLTGKPTVVPGTPAGVMQLLKLSGIDLKGKEAVVVGRSNIVGKPMAQLLLMADATVTVCHSHSHDLAAHVRQADVLIAAVGRPQMIPGSWIKPGAIVIDVGINRLPESQQIVGDVDFASAVKVAGAITPVPGGVGPMTVAMLMQNTLALAKKSIE